MRLLVEKIILLFLLFLLGFGTGTSPFMLRNRCLSPSHCRDWLVSLLNCFSAGVFFATFFLHMMPEAQVEFQDVFGTDIDYPFAELLLSGGFFFVMVIEQLVTGWYEKKRTSKPSDCQLDNCNESSFCDQCKEQSSLAPLLRETKSLVSFCEKKSFSFTRSKSLGQSALVSEPENESCCNNRTEGVLNQASDCEETEDVNDIFSLQENALSTAESANHGHFDSQLNVRSFILLFALSTHALFEGLAIGFQTSTSALRSLMFAVVIHKMALAFSFGISLVNTHARTLHVFLSMFVFSVMAPVGIGIGALLNFIKSENTAVEMFVALMQAFAAGTFVYIIFVEIIPHEFVTAKSEKRLSKLFCLAVGFALMAGLQAIPHEEE